MAKTCLNKLAGNVLQRCTVAPVGIKNIYLMHAEDVTLALSAASATLTSVAFASGARSYLVEGYKQNIQVTSSLRSMDASAKLDISVSFKAPRSMIQTYNTGEQNYNTMMPILSGRFYVLVDYVDGASSDLLGATSPLEVTAFDFDSNAGAGLATLTLGTPEGSAGNYFLTSSAGARNSIISKSV